MDTAQAQVLRRMARAATARRGRDPAGDVWRRALPRAAADALGLDLTVTAVAERTVDLSDAVAQTGEGALLLSLVEDGAVVGLAIVDAGLLAALIEVQTTGRVSSARRDPRAPTAVDAALARHALDTWLAAVADLRGATAPGTGRHFPDTRAATLALEEGEGTETAVDLDLGGGRRTGRLRLLLARPLTVPDGPDPDALRATLLPVEATLHAVLCRVRLPLSRVAALAPGDLLPLDGVSPRRIRLEAPLGRLIAPAHLGQSRGHRAVRVLAPAEDGGSALPPDLGGPHAITGTEGAWSIPAPLPD